MPATGKINPPTVPPGFTVPDHWRPKRLKVAVTDRTWAWADGWGYNGAYVCPEPSSSPPWWWVYLPSSELSVVLLRTADRAFFVGEVMAKDCWRAVRLAEKANVLAALPPWFVPWKDAFLKSKELLPPDSFKETYK